MNWTDLTTALALYAQQDNNPAAQWALSLPTIVNNAELRIYRDLDFLATRGQNRSLFLTPGERTLSMAPMTGQMPAGFLPFNAYPIVVQGFASLVPTGTLSPVGTDDSGAPITSDSGAAATTDVVTGSLFRRTRFVATTVDFIDHVWPDETVTKAPSIWLAYYAMLDHQTVLLAPTPDQAYQVEITGTWRPAPMNATNQQSWLGNNLADLLFKAAMVEAAGWLRDFGQQADDPKLAQSWESQYQAAKMAAIEEEQRRKGQDPGWAPYSPTPLSGSPRH